MQAYGPGFARVYNSQWGGFARQLAPRLLEWHERTYAGSAGKNVLDLCCGTGQLALYFLEKGYKVTGIDLSEPMLRFAREPQDRPHGFRCDHPTAAPRLPVAGSGGPDGRPNHRNRRLC